MPCTGSAFSRHACVGSMPDSEHTSACCTPCGGLNGVDRRARQRADHEVVPDLAGTGDAQDVVHRRVVGVADPYAGHQVGRVADDPRIAELVGGARLDRGRSIPGSTSGLLRAVRRLARLVVGQDRRDLVDQPRVGDLGATSAWYSYSTLPAGVGHFQDGHRVELPEALSSRSVGGHVFADLLAAVGEHRIGVGQVEQLDLAAAERDRQTVAVRIAQVGDAEAGARWRSSRGRPRTAAPGRPGCCATAPARRARSSGPGTCRRSRSVCSHRGTWSGCPRAPSPDSSPCRTR